MNRWLVLLLSVLICLILSCGMRKSERHTSGSAGIELVEFTRLDEYPGVESDLVSTRTFALEFRWKDRRQPAVVGLLFDDVLLEPMAMNRDETQKAGHVKLKFSMAVYRQGSQWAEDYALQQSPFGRLKHGHYALAVGIDGRLDSISLPSPRALPSVYYP